MTPSLDGPRAKIKRANEHFHDLNLEVQAFLNLNPYGVLLEEDPQRGEQVARAQVAQEPPVQLSILVGDVVHNLRAALDHLVWQLVLNDSGTPGTWTEFPVVWKPSDWKAKKYKVAGTKKEKGASPDVVDAIDQLQPYHRGNDYMMHPIWRIHEFDVRDKHRFLNIVGCALRSQSLSLGLAPGQTEGFVGSLNVTMGSPQIISPLEDGTELGRSALKDATNVQMDREFTFEVAFEEGGAGQGEPIIPTLQQFIDFIDQTVSLFDSRFPYSVLH